MIALAEPADMWDLRAEALLEAGILARNEGRLDHADRLLAETASVAAGHEDWLRVGQTLRNARRWPTYGTSS